MPLFLIALGALVVYFAPGMARQNSAFYKRAYGVPVPFPRLWAPFFRAGGLVLVLVGVVMLLGIGVRAR